MFRLIIRSTLLLLSLIVIGSLILRYIVFNGFEKKTIDNTKKVYIQKENTKFNLIRNDKEFLIKGAAAITKYFKELSEADGNTVRVYETSNLGTVLDSAQANNLAVIVDIYVPKYTENYDFYSSKKNCLQLNSNIKKLINKHKDHPALLFWNLGNEVNYPLVFKKNNFINTYNQLIDLIHSLDPNHPIATSIIRKREIFSILLHSPKLDLFGFNIFGNLKKLKSDLFKANMIANPFPYYISEFANNGPWEEQFTSWGVPIEQTTLKKAEQYRDKYESYIKTDKESLGSLAFFWGFKQEYTHTWFNIFDEKGKKSESYYTLQSLWKESPKVDYIHPSVTYMLINGKGAKENLVFKPNETQSIDLFFEEKKQTSFTYKWGVYKEKWHENNSINNINKPLLNVLDSLTDNKSSINFKTPNEEGPYRVFVNVYDDKGNFSSCNIPFYILNNSNE